MSARNWSCLAAGAWVALLAGASGSWAQTPYPSTSYQGGVPRSIVLPPHLPASCFAEASRDYKLPAEVMLAIVKHESGGRSVVARNTNGSLDIGVAQLNTNSWVPYFEKRYGISRQSLLSSPCQSIRAQAYTLRMEMNSAECKGVDVWCAVGRYHAPNNLQHRANYVPKVQAALKEMLTTGFFDKSMKVVGTLVERSLPAAQAQVQPPPIAQGEPLGEPVRIVVTTD